jgi:type IV pilus assembly protein PilA
MQNLHSRLRGKQRAFTLIELLVVILIIAVLIAVAAPTFLGQQSKAHDSAAKQDLTVAYKAAKSDAVSRDPQGAFGSAANVRAVLAQNEPQLNVAASGTPAEGEVAVCDDSDSNQLRLSGLSKSGKNFVLVAPANDKQTLAEGSCSGGDDGGGSPVSYAAAVAADSPLVQWHFDDAPGSEVISSATGNADLSNWGGPQFEQTAGLVSTEGPAARFDGGAEYATYTTAVPSGDWSFELWLRLDAPQAFSQINMFIVGGPMVYNFAIFGTTLVGIYTEEPFELASLIVGQTYHLVLTSDGVTQRGYLNGVEIASAPDNSAPLGEETLYDLIGNGGGIVYDEGAMYDTALSPARVLAHYSAGTQ